MDLDKFVEQLELKEMPTFKEYSEIFDKLKKELGLSKDEGLSIKIAFGIREKIGEYFIQRNYENKGDLAIKKILEAKYNHFFSNENLKEMDSNKTISHPIYVSLIIELQELSRYGKNESFKYLLDNINLNNIDIDMMALANAVKYSQNNIVALLLDYSKNNDYDGKNGEFTKKLQSNINENLSNLSLNLQDKMVETFKWVEKPKFDFDKAVSSELKNEEQKKIEQYKKMFPGLNW